MKRGLLIVTAACLVWASLFGPSVPGAAAAERTVRVESISFAPQDVYIAAGDTVVWRYSDEAGAPHSVESTSSERFDSSRQCDLDPLTVNDDCMTASRNSTYRHTFNNVGDFTYRCEIHHEQGMVGTVHVRPRGSTEQPSPTPTRTRSSSPSPSGSATTTGSPDPSATATATGTATGTGFPSFDPSESPRASGRGGSGGAAPVAVAALALAALSGAGFLVYRRFFAQ